MFGKYFHKRNFMYFFIFDPTADLISMNVPDT